MKQCEYQKKMGQFFSGPMVADLLVSLIPKDSVYKRVVDPMCGIGDLLFAAKREFSPQEIIGVEIDKHIAMRCLSRMNDATIESTDAFTSHALAMTEGCDLVIANPPYVRYQITASEEGSGNSEEVRKNLLQILRDMPYLVDRERGFLQKIAQTYSGFADLAVPSWILCASLLKHDGILAIVVPETWMSREYARPIQYMLLKCFDVLYLARDVSAGWFADAQVRTCLVVARRHAMRDISFDKSSETFLADIAATARGDSGLVDLIEYNGKKGKNAFDEIVRRRIEVEIQGLRTVKIQAAHLFPNLFKNIESQPWFAEEKPIVCGETAMLPHEMHGIVGNVKVERLCTLGNFGVRCWQGLRSGANDFFYLKRKKTTRGWTLFENKDWSSGELKFSSRYVIPLLHKRTNEKLLVVTTPKLTECVLVIKNAVRNSDYNLLKPELRSSERIIEPELSRYIDEAEIVSVKGTRKFYQLSAVAPNIKKDKQGYYTSFWYMLPPLAERHMPQLCVQRISGSCAQGILVRQSKRKPIVVDANFITLTCPQANLYKIFALLNSTWFKVYMELIGTVMGGGALKCETINLTNVLFPSFTKEQLAKLESLGRKLAKAGKTSEALQRKIDAVVFAPLECRPKGLTRDFLSLLERKLKERGALND